MKWDDFPEVFRGDGECSGDRDDSNSSTENIEGIEDSSRHEALDDSGDDRMNCQSGFRSGCGTGESHWVKYLVSYTETVCV